MDDYEFTQAIKGAQKKEERFFDNHRYYMAWLITHIYSNNPYAKRRVKISDLIKVEGDKKTDEISEAEKMAKMDAIFEKWDKAKERLSTKNNE